MVVKQGHAMVYHGWLDHDISSEKLMAVQTVRVVVFPRGGGMKSRWLCSVVGVVYGLEEVMTVVMSVSSGHLLCGLPCLVVTCLGSHRHNSPDWPHILYILAGSVFRLFEPNIIFKNPYIEYLKDNVDVILTAS